MDALPCLGTDSNNGHPLNGEFRLRQVGFVDGHHAGNLLFLNKCQNGGILLRQSHRAIKHQHGNVSAIQRLAGAIHA